MVIGGLLFLALLLLLSFTGIPIAFGIGILSFVVIAVLFGFNGALNVMAIQYFGTWSESSLMSFPFFILMAEFITGAEYDEDLFDMSSKWFGNIKGSLAIVAIILGALFGALCGSSVAAAVTIGALTLPKMIERGYDKRLASGAVAAAGGLAQMIPPSLLAIVYACLAETSVSKQLMAGLLPGIVLTLTFCIVSYFYYIHTSRGKQEIIQKFSWKDKFISLEKATPVVVLGLLLMGAIYFGVTTPTEASAVGACLALVLMIMRRKLNSRSLTNLLFRAGENTCFIMAIVFSGTLFSFLLSYLGVSQKTVQVILTFGFPPWVIMAIIQVIYLILGCFLDGVSMLVLTLPVLLPVVGALGFDPVWFGVVYLLNVEIAMITPPVGLVLYAVKGIAPKEVTLLDVLWGSVPYLFAKLFVLVLVMIFPQIALWIPSHMR